MTTTEAALLPAEFADLEPFAAKWAIPGREDRYQTRLASTMDELQEFYEAVHARGDEIFTYLDQFELEDMPDDALRLLWIVGSLSCVSMAVEVFKEPKVRDCGATHIGWVKDPVP